MGFYRIWRRTPEFDCKFLAYQREQCPETGRLHWQGYVCFANPMGLKGVKRFLPTAHWEVRRGSHEDALDYVTKERTRVQGTSPVIRGEPPKQGKRSDLEDFTRAAIGGATDRELLDDFPVSFLRYGRALGGIRLACLEDRSWKTITIVLHGPTGCGKSRWAHETFLKRTRRIRPSGGMSMLDNPLSSSMNSMGNSNMNTCSNSWTGIPSLSKSKMGIPGFVPSSSLLRPMQNQQIGTQDLLSEESIGNPNSLEELTIITPTLTDTGTVILDPMTSLPFEDVLYPLQKWPWHNSNRKDAERGPRIRSWSF